MIMFYVAGVLRYNSCLRKYFWRQYFAFLKFPLKWGISATEAIFSCAVIVDKEWVFHKCVFCFSLIRETCLYIFTLICLSYSYFWCKSFGWWLSEL